MSGGWRIVAVAVAVAGLGAASGLAAGAVAGGTPSKSKTITIHESGGANGLFLFALNQVGHAEPRCFGLSGALAATFDQGAPSPDMLRTLGVLRGAATADDHVARSLLERTNIHGVLVHYVRRVRTPDGVSYVLIPSSNAHYVPLPPPSCDAALARAIRRH